MADLRDGLLAKYRGQARLRPCRGSAILLFWAAAIPFQDARCTSGQGGRAGARQGATLLLPHPPRHRNQDSLPGLDTPEQINLSASREAALRARAARRREEIAVKRDDFELIKAKLVFGIQLFASVAALIAIMVILIAKPALIPATLLAGGVLRGVLGLGRTGP